MMARLHDPLMGALSWVVYGGGASRVLWSVLAVGVLVGVGLAVFIRWVWDLEGVDRDAR